uniref:WD_REPEATS_REGION domain-containing protein n=1 Tax=Strongyloides papillosus TaxID=174720 RepID=A0A0N5BWT0_STREA
MVQIDEISSYKLQQRPAYCKYFDNFNTIIASTYQLENFQDRSGSFVLFNNQLEKINEIKLEAGVFRFDVDNFQNNQILASLTNGKLGFVNLENSEIKYSKKLSDGMLLNQCQNYKCNNYTIITTDNLGGVFIVDSGKEYEIVESKVVHLLPYVKTPCEVWSCGFLKINDENIFGTGGDDGILKIWDKRQGLNLFIDTFETNDNSGVTFISNSLYNENEYIVGSYDEIFRIFDIRNMKEPKNSIKLNGGIWYIEEHFIDNIQKFYCSCMYGGWNLVENNDNSLSVKISNNNHGKDLLYGVSRVNDYNIVSTTFNDFTIRLESIK